MNAPDRLTIHAMGGLTISLNGRRIAESTDARRGVLLVYLADQREAHSRKAVARLLWPQSLDDVALGSLRTLLTRLRQEGVAPFVLAGRQTIQLAPEAVVDYDVAHFRQVLRTPENADITTLTAALNLFTGHFLQDALVQDSPDVEEWASRTQRELETLATTGWLRLVELYRAAGQFKEAADSAARLLVHAPYDDEAHALYMRALAADRRPAEALQHYNTYCRAMQEEFGLDALSPELAALAEELRAGSVQDMPPRRAETPAAARGSLIPTPVQPLFGRRRELCQLQEWVTQDTTHIVSLVGLGGVGKTRLAVALAQALEHQFADGVWYVDLATEDATVCRRGDDVADLCRDLVVRAIGRTLGLAFFGAQPIHEQLLAALADQQICLVLDNFEDLLPAAPYLADIAHAAPAAKLVVTTRTRLNLAIERAFFLEGLSIPQSPDTHTLTQSDAVQLFLDAARRRFPSLEVTESSAPAIAEICRITGGLPLALLIIASWTEHFRLEEIPEQLTTKIAYLGADAVDVPDRQRDFNAVIAWAWRRLDARMQRVLAVLSVSANPFSRAAAHGIAGASVEEMSALVRHALLRIDRPGQYRMHPLVRSFARAQLRLLSTEENDLVASATARHAAYYLDMFTQEAERAGLDSRRDEYANLQTALKWYVQHAPATLVEQLPRLDLFWQRQGFLTDARAWLAALLPSTTEGSRERADTLSLAAVYAQQQGDFQTAAKMKQTAIQLYQALGRLDDLAAAYEHMGWIEYDHNPDVAVAEGWFKRSLAIHRDAGDQERLASILWALTGCFVWVDADRAASYLAQAAALADEPAPLSMQIKMTVAELILAMQRGQETETARLYDHVGQWFKENSIRPYGDAYNLLVLAVAALYLSRLADAASWAEAALAGFTQVRAKGGIQDALLLRAVVRRKEGRWHEAYTGYQDAVRQRVPQPEPIRLLRSAIGVADCARALGDQVRAIRMLGAAAGLLADLPPYQRLAGQDERREFATIRAAVEAGAKATDADFDALWEQGAAMSIDAIAADILADAKSPQRAPKSV